MATRSFIAYQDPTTKEYHSVYCHWDGYVGFNGQILEKAYNNLEVVQKLISKGDISTLYNQREADGVLYAPLHYHAWRDENWGDVKPKVTSDLKALFKLANNSWAEYLYVFTDGKWLYSNTLGRVNSLKSLTDEVESIDKDNQFSDEDIDLIKDAISAFYGASVDVTPVVGNTDSDDGITCESIFVGNVFGYQTNLQWVFKTVDWLDDCIRLDGEHPLHKLSKAGYRALMRDITKALDDNWDGIHNLEALETGLRDSLDNLNFDNQSTLVITAKGYASIFDDINKKLADGAYIIK